MSDPTPLLESLEDTQAAIEELFDRLDTGEFPREPVASAAVEARLLAERAVDLLADWDCDD